MILALTKMFIALAACGAATWYASREEDRTAKVPVRIRRRRR